MLRHEAARDSVTRIVRERVAGGAEVLVPGHFWLEIVNVLGRRYRHPPARVVSDVHRLDEFEIRTVEIDRPQLLLTIDRIARFGLTAYDAVYLALAESLDAALLTLDGRLIGAAGLRAIRAGPHRLAEEPARYRTDTARIWAEYGAYLAELRGKALAG